MPADEMELVELIKSANDAGEKIKVVGAGHSFSAVALTDGHMISLDKMKKILSVNGTHVRVQGGIRLYDLNAQLEQLGLSLENLGATCEQSIAGVTATATHGTGRLTGNMASQIEALRIVTANGTVLEASKDDANKEFFNAARVGIGSLGVISELTLRTLPLFRMKLTNSQMPLDQLLADLPSLMEKYERLQWFWLPPDEQYATLVTREVTQEPITPGGCWGEDVPPTQIGDPEAIQGVRSSPCVDVSYKTMCGSPSHYAARNLYTEMEMFIPVEHTANAIADFRKFQAQVLPAHNSSIGLFTGVRYVKGDDMLISTAAGRDTAVISNIVMGPSKQEAGDIVEFARYAMELERLTVEKYGGRPHWGKKNWATRETLRQAYGDDAWKKFLKFRQMMDPKGIFLNDYLLHRLPMDLVSDVLV